MASKKVSNSGSDRGRKAESKRLTAQGVSVAKQRLSAIGDMKKVNPGAGVVIPRRQEKQLKKFVRKYGK